ncbi:Localization factor PodJS [Phenylobacterium sp. LjRoot219]|uniref:SEL1-like repeat protein n=1 Tax=Phenylobacterium sp. LjRoot219 TaxID=3342283 RepID=UPI003ECF5850
MTAGAPWSVKGIDPKAREVAKDHARRSGMTLGEWLNRVILEDDGAETAASEPAPYAAPEPPARFPDPPPRPRLVAETPAPRGDDLGRVAHALDRLTDRLEASETRTGLAVSSIEHSVRQAVARIEASERESLAVATRVDGAVDRISSEGARLAERLRRLESEAAAGPRSTEALRALEQSVGRVSAQIYESEGRARDSVAALEARLARTEARDPAKFMDEVVQRLGDRLANAERHTAEALDALRRSLATLDTRVGAVEGGRGGDAQKFEALAQALTEQVEAARTQVSERLKAVDGGRVDRRFAELAAEVKAAEQRSARAIQQMGRDVLGMADSLNRRLQDSEDRNAAAIAQVGGEMARVAGAMEARLGRAEQTQTEGLERLSTELGRITDKLSDRLLVSERRAAEAIDDVGEQVSRVSERMAQSQERAAQDLADKIRESEERTARLLEETGARLEQRLGEAPRAVAEPVPAPSIAIQPPPAPSPAAFGPELFSRAEDVAEDEELDLTDTMPPALPPFAAARFEPTDDFAPIPEPEEDLFGLEQPEPPADAEVKPSLSTREVIEQARAAARAAAPAEKPERLQAKAKASWRTSRPATLGGGFFSVRPRRAPSSTLQTAIMVAGGAAFLSVGAAGVVLMQGPSPAPAAEIAAADQAQPARAAVALGPQALGGLEPASTASGRPPAQLADALLAAFGKAARGVEAGEPGALAKLKAIAEAGHPPAQFYLGKLYETGEHGVTQNLAEARRWTERAAEGGDAAAMHNLALFDFRGEGGAQDLTAAARWFRAAAEQGIVDSQFNLGLLYQSGSGVARDPVQAYTWFTIAAAGGDAQARSNAQVLQAQLTPAQRAAAEQAAHAFAVRSHAGAVQQVAAR